MTDVARALGMVPGGGTRVTLQRSIDRLGLSTAHFEQRVAHVPLIARPLEEVLVEHSTYSRAHLKTRLYKEGIKVRECELCGQGETWRGGRLALILDHINGIGDDNRLENLRIVCPNCAATFDTHCGRVNARRLNDRACRHCKATFRPTYRRQRYCSRDCGLQSGLGKPRPETRRAERPPYEVLVARIAAEGYEAVGRAHGVSGNAVRKWVRSYERERAATGAAPAVAAPPGEVQTVRGESAPLGAAATPAVGEEPGRRGA